MKNVYADSKCICYKNEFCVLRCTTGNYCSISKYNIRFVVSLVKLDEIMESAATTSKSFDLLDIRST